MGVSRQTIYRWFKRGLEYAKLGGKVFTSLEAVQRFSQQPRAVQKVQPLLIDRETAAAIKSLKARGIIFCQEATTKKPQFSRRGRSF